ncbi:MAG: DUF378 domain-containing protein [Deltaproteobacteria bacterium]|nr:DUF378 domain-containing protein [Deltaproteobacteria bacterium]
MEKPCIACKVVCALLVIGALNWGLMAFHHNVISHFLGDMTHATRGVYILIGLAGLMGLIKFFKGCPGCKKC